MDQNVTVRVQAKTDAGMANPFKQMAADGKKLEASFDGITKSVKLSQQAMAKFADSIKFASEQSKKFAQWSGGAGGNAAGGGNAGGAGGAGGGLMQANQAWELMNRLSTSTRGLITAFDDLSKGVATDRQQLRQGGPLGAQSADLADFIEDWSSWGRKKIGSPAYMDPTGYATEWERRADAREKGRVESQLIEAGDFGRQFRDMGRAGAGQLEDQIFAARQNAGDSTAAQIAAADAMSRRFAGQAGGYLAGAKGAFAGSGRSGFSEGLARGEQTSALRFAEDAQKKLIDAEQKKLDLIRQQGKERQDQLKTQLEAAKTEEARLKNIIDQEKGRLGGFAGEFGRLDPLQQEQARQLAAKAAGGKLSRDELEAARGFGFFGDVVARQDQQAGEAAGFGNIAKQLGLDLKLREAEIAVKAVVEAKVELEQKIAIELKQSDDAVVKQLADVLLPELEKLQNVREQRIKAEFEKQLYQQKIARNQ